MSEETDSSLSQFDNLLNAQTKLIKELDLMSGKITQLERSFKELQASNPNRSCEIFFVFLVVLISVVLVFFRINSL